MSTYLESMDTRELILLSADVRHDFHKAKERLKKVVGYYYNQSIASTYHKEEDIAMLVNRCKNLKKQYLEMRDILLDRGVQERELMTSSWNGTNDDLFARNSAHDILHSA